MRRKSHKAQAASGTPAKGSKGDSAQPDTQSTGTSQSAGTQKKASPKDPTETLVDIIENASEEHLEREIKRRLSEQAAKDKAISNQYCVVALYADITDYESGQVYRVLRAANGDKKKNVLLLVDSPGGEIEPAYQISKMCKEYSKDSFVVVVSRKAKSAATLLAMGADTVHMSQLGQLGPIDPQLGGMPALGIVQALKTIASITEGHPRSATMFAHYLKESLTVEQIGYCERIAEAAVQYAERLLRTKPYLSKKATQIAHLLVYEYKHHGFVIDRAEARSLLDKTFILTKSPELDFAEKLYSLFDFMKLGLRVARRKSISVAGDFNRGVLIVDLPKRAR